MEFRFPTQTIFYTIENAIKQYRKISQKRIQEVVNDITIDQALVLTIIEGNPEFTQIDISELLFKDYASMTRMINLLVKNGHLSRVTSDKDKRRSKLSLTKKGTKTIAILKPIILLNRASALERVSRKEQKELANTLTKIIANCSK